MNERRYLLLNGRKEKPKVFGIFDGRASACKAAYEMSRDVSPYPEGWIEAVFQDDLLLSEDGPYPRFLIEGYETNRVYAPAEETHAST